MNSPYYKYCVKIEIELKKPRIQVPYFFSLKLQLLLIEKLLEFC